MSFSIFMRFIVVAIMYHRPVESTTKILDLEKFQPLMMIIITLHYVIIGYTTII